MQPLRSASCSVGPWLGLAVGALLFGCARRNETTTAEPAKVPSKLEVPPAARGVDLTQNNGTVLTDIAERALPAVVSVASTRAAKMDSPELPLGDPFFRRFFGPMTPSPFPRGPGEAPVEHGLGSGVLVGKGLILTNAHVVEGARQLEVTAVGRRTLKAELVGVDAKSDLAVLKTTTDTTGITPLEFGDSSKVRLGQVVLAIGNPFGVGETVTMGIVSAKGRADLGIEAYEDFIQTDAAINPGNSGGALIDLEGHLVGIPTAILSQSGGYMGVGFAIPSNMAKPIVQSLVEHGKVVRGYLGVAIQNVDAELAAALKLPNTDGVLISDVAPNGPAAKAGLQRGDVIVSVAGEKMTSTGQLRNAIAQGGVGKSVSVELVRNGTRQTKNVVLGELAAEVSSTAKATPTAPTSAPSAGLDVQPLDGGLRTQLGVPPDLKGVVVSSVEPASPAVAAGLRPGDVIVEVNHRACANPAQFSEAWRASSGAVPVLVWREKHTFYAVLKH